MAAALQPLLHPQGDATYLVVTDDGKLENYGLNAVCTHLGACPGSGMVQLQMAADSVPAGTGAQTLLQGKAAV